jgi:hypothetical protein
MSGADHLKATVARLRKASPKGRPEPGTPWEYWAEERLKRLEDQQVWLLRALVGAGAVAVLKLVLSVLGLG